LAIKYKIKKRNKTVFTLFLVPQASQLFKASVQIQFGFSITAQPHAQENKKKCSQLTMNF